MCKRMCVYITDNMAAVGCFCPWIFHEFQQTEIKFNSLTRIHTYLLKPSRTHTLVLSYRPEILFCERYCSWVRFVSLINHMFGLKALRFSLIFPSFTFQSFSFLVFAFSSFSLCFYTHTHKIFLPKFSIKKVIVWKFLILLIN